MNKKFRYIAAAAGLSVLAFTGCGSSDDSGQTATKAESSVKSGSYVFKANGSEIYVGEAESDVLSALGEANSEFTQVSCAFEGEDNMYMYDGFQVTVSTVNEARILTSIELTDDTVKTPEGLAIGSSEDDVIAKMNTEKSADGNYSFTGGKTELSIVTKDGAVISVTYSYAQ